MKCCSSTPADRNSIYWLEQSLSDVPVEDAWLTSAELVTLSHLRFPKRREDWRLGRWTAKSCIAAYLKMSRVARELSCIEIRAADSGAPFAVLLDTNATFAISLTHRSGKAMCAVAPANVDIGCDLELIEERSAAFLSDYFTPDEQTLVEHTATDRKPLVLNLLWSAKESALKALHTGLRADTRSLTVCPSPETKNRWSNSHPIRLLETAPSTYGSNVPTWQPLQVTLGDHRVLHGWWMVSDPFVRTVVSKGDARFPEKDESPNSNH